MIYRLLVFSFLFLSFNANANFSDFAYSDKWLKIVHYQPKFLGGYRATIGSDTFYLSPLGKTDPKNELKATIEMFQSDDNKTKCLFPARYKLLKDNGLIDSDFPECTEYESFKTDLQPSGITFLFTDAYMNNSSSLFGHTLLRIDTKRKGTQLLAHGINYGAFTKGYEDSFLYAVYGLIGAYQGGFTVKPYYDIINTYNNLENRDIWEYGLNLSQDELDLFVAHIWEIGQTLTPYYFFTLNCSYMLMEALDAVKPELNLAKLFKVQTIPLDTIKAVNQQKGLIKQVKYRPSREKKIKHRIKQMNKNQYQSLLKIVKQDEFDFSLLNEEEKADVLETAYQYVQYQHIAKDLELTDYRKKSFSILKQRNSLKVKPSFDELETGINPVSAHNSAMLSVSIGAQNGDVFEEISIRPAYHSLIDNNKGFLQGAEINFLDTKFRHYDDDNKYVLEKLNILELASFSPIDKLFAAPSYDIKLNIARTFNPKTQDNGYVFNTSVASGATFALNQNVLAYFLSSVDGAYGGFLTNNAWIGLGLKAGFIATYDKLGIKAEVKKTYASASVWSNLKFEFEAETYLSQNWALAAKFGHQINKQKDVSEHIFGIKHYF